jgi:hypothetical protein
MPAVWRNTVKIDLEHSRECGQRFQRLGYISLHRHVELKRHELEPRDRALTPHSPLAISSNDVGSNGPASKRSSRLDQQTQCFQRHRRAFGPGDLGTVAKSFVNWQEVRDPLVDPAYGECLGTAPVSSGLGAADLRDPRVRVVEASRPDQNRIFPGKESLGSLGSALSLDLHKAQEVRAHVPANRRSIRVVMHGSMSGGSS